jgi:methionyl-tRNA formyltransferase
MTNVVDRLRRVGLRESEKNYLEEFAKANNISDINSSLTDVCKRENIECIKSDSINSSYMVDHVREKEIDILINAGGGIFRNSIINAPRIGILNAHMGYLPRFRGFNVLEWSLIYEEVVGVTLHFIDQGIDTGDILMFKEIPLEKGDTILSLRKKTGVINIELMIDCVRLFKIGNVNRVKQLKEEGKQYFVMHHRLKDIAEVKLSKSWAGQNEVSLRAKNDFI